VKMKGPRIDVFFTFSFECPNMIINRPKFINKSQIHKGDTDMGYYEWTIQSSVFGYRTSIATYITEFFTDYYE